MCFIEGLVLFLLSYTCNFGVLRVGLPAHSYFPSLTLGYPVTGMYVDAGAETGSEVG